MQIMIQLVWGSLGSCSPSVFPRSADARQLRFHRCAGQCARTGSNSLTGNLAEVQILEPAQTPKSDPPRVGPDSLWVSKPSR